MRQPIFSIKAFSILFLALLPASISFAQTDNAWTNKVVTKVLKLQYDDTCFSDKPEFRHVHVLGVANSDKLLSTTQQALLLNALSDALRTGTPNRITTAATFEYIATKDISFGKKGRQRLERLLQQSGDADITVLLRPLETAGRNLTTQLIIWAFDRKGGEQYNCTALFTIPIRLRRHEDPACAENWNRADADGTSADYRAFAKYFPHCPQKKDALRSLARLERQTCSEEWAAASAADSAETYANYAATNSTCPLAEAARILALKLRRQATTALAKTARVQPELEPETQPAVEQTSLRDQVERYIAWDYLQDREEFTSVVDYYDKGMVSRAKVLEDKRKYARRWPKRKYRLLPGSLQVRTASNQSLDVRFGFSFAVANSRKTAQGTGRVALRLLRHGDRFIVQGVRELTD